VLASIGSRGGVVDVGVAVERKASAVGAADGLARPLRQPRRNGGERDVNVPLVR
ncbi:MAG: hypothetical protein K0R38_4176, partial [Polyangiaceae bacterium]|nr:hypothetical protein [Polyangiaceae bacterium]